MQTGDESGKLSDGPLPGARGSVLPGAYRIQDGVVHTIEAEQEHHLEIEEAYLGGDEPYMGEICIHTIVVDGVVETAQIHAQDRIIVHSEASLRCRIGHIVMAQYLIAPAYDSSLSSRLTYASYNTSALSCSVRLELV